MGNLPYALPGVQCNQVAHFTRGLLDPDHHGARNNAVADVQLFDLERDPCEFMDVSRDAAYSADLADLRAAAAEWRDASRLPETHLDEEAPVIRQPNVPARGDGHRGEMSSSYRARVEAMGLLRPE